MAFRQEELKGLERSLAARAQRLRGEVSEKLDQGAEDVEGMNDVGDTGDHAFAVTETNLDRAEAERDMAELRAIEAALKAIEDGSYGLCASCGQEIPEERLRAQPLALRCVRCQEHLERTTAHR